MVCAKRSRAVPGQAGHEVDPRFEPPLPEEGQRPDGVGRRVAAPRTEQDFIVERLRTHLDRRHAEGLEEVEAPPRPISSGRVEMPDAVDRALPEKGRREFEESPLFLPRHAGERPAVEGDLDGTAFRAGAAQIGADGLRERRFRDRFRAVAGGQPLVAEEAAVGAAPVHDEEGDDHRHRLSGEPSFGIV